MEDFFSGHPLSQSVLGTEESIGQMSADDMRNYFEQRYAPGNMCLAAAGNVDFEKLVDDAERFCGQWKSFGAAREPVLANYRGGFEQIIKSNSHQQYLMQLSPGPSVSDPDRFAVRVLSAILGDDGGSRMFWEFLDSGKAESAGMGAYEYFDSGLVMTYICCAPEEAQDNLIRLRKLQTEAVAGGISQRELDLAKRKIASHIVLASERTGSRMFSVGSQWLADQPFLTTGEIAAIYEAVTLEQVTAALEKYPLTNNMTLVVGPRSDLQPVE
jgi:predicted Zn-dependent peptidase